MAFAETNRLRELDDLKTRLFGGSISSLVMQALGSNKKADVEEIEKIKEFLDQFEG